MNWYSKVKRAIWAIKSNLSNVHIMIFNKDKLKLISYKHENILKATNDNLKL